MCLLWISNSLLPQRHISSWKKNWRQILSDTSIPLLFALSVSSSGFEEKHLTFHVSFRLQIPSIQPCWNAPMLSILTSLVDLAVTSVFYLNGIEQNILENGVLRDEILVGAFSGRFLTIVLAILFWGIEGPLPETFRLVTIIHNIHLAACPGESPHPPKFSDTYISKEVFFFCTTGGTCGSEQIAHTPIGLWITRQGFLRDSPEGVILEFLIVFIFWRREEFEER